MCMCLQWYGRWSAASCIWRPALHATGKNSLTKIISVSSFFWVCFLAMKIHFPQNVKGCSFVSKKIQGTEMSYAYVVCAAYCSVCGY